MRLTLPILWLAGALVVPLVAGIVSVIRANIAVEYRLQDAYYVVVDGRYALAVPGLFVVFAAVYLAAPRLGFAYDSRLGFLHLGVTIVGALLVLSPETLFVGLMGPLAWTGLALICLGLGVFFLMIREAIRRKHAS